MASNAETNPRISTFLELIIAALHVMRSMTDVGLAIKRYGHPLAAKASALNPSAGCAWKMVNAKRLIDGSKAANQRPDT